jgi:large subunit ribosomal protein L3
MRVGIIAKKLGMSAIFIPTGQRVPVTLLHVENCEIIAAKSFDGKHNLLVGAFDKKESRTSKPLRGLFAKASVGCKQKLVEFRVDESAVLQPGTKIGADHYVEGQFIDVTGTSIGKGFAGGMKRHNFGGLRASHGVSVSHRSHGSTGNRQDPGKVFKNKKMAGHMGDVRVTTQNLKIMQIDAAKGLIAVKGAVPGSKNSFVIIKDAVKRALPQSAPYPAVKIEQSQQN